MNNYKCLFLILLTVLSVNLGFAATPPKPANPSAPLVIKLNTQESLLPICIGKIESDQSAYPQNYLDQLREILRFDFNYNGMSKVLSADSAKNMLNQSTYDQPGDMAKWREIGAYYLLQGKVSGGQLNLRMISIGSGKAKTIQGIALKGDLAQDRKVLHHIHDQLHQELFNKPGVAATRFLYAKRLPLAGGKEWSSEIWEADWDGGNDTQLTRNSGYSVTPSYLPPQQAGYRSGSFFYVSYQNGQPKIYIASLKDGNGKRLTYLRGNQMTPAVNASRDGIAFICDATGNPDLFLQPFNPNVGATGKPRQIYTAPQAAQGTPAFSPDGNKIVFVSNKNGTPKIFVMNVPPPGARLKDIEATLITKANQENTSPAWSPDGTKIAYSAKNGGNERQIWIYDFTTGKESQLTGGPGHKENPTWGPNSLHLIFNRVENEGCELYLVNLHQPEAVRISNGKGEKRFPSWEPRVD
jgi:TolB protein